MSQHADRAHPWVWLADTLLLAVASEVLRVGVATDIIAGVARAAGPDCRLEGSKVQLGWHAAKTQLWRNHNQYTTRQQSAAAVRHQQFARGHSPTPGGWPLSGGPIDRGHRQPPPGPPAPARPPPTATTAGGLSLSPTASANPAVGDRVALGHTTNAVMSERVPSPSRYLANVDNGIHNMPGMPQAGVPRGREKPLVWGNHGSPAFSGY